MEVTSVIARPRIRFRDYEGCSGPILVLFFSLDSYCPQLSKSQNHKSQITKTKEVTVVNSKQIHFKAMVRRDHGVAGACS